MKIKKSKLETIIREEMQNMAIDEGWKDIGRAFVKGFMGDAASDNPFSKGAYAAYGAAFVPRVDKAFKKLLEEIKEFKNHAEAEKVVDPAKNSNKNPDLLVREFEDMLGELAQEWIRMTANMRGPDDEKPADDEPAPSDEGGEEEVADESGEEAEEDIAEVIRREIRQTLKERGMFEGDSKENSSKRETWCAKLEDGSTRTILVQGVSNKSTIEAKVARKLKRTKDAKLVSLSKGACS